MSFNSMFNPFSPPSVPPRQEIDRWHQCPKHILLDLIPTQLADIPSFSACDGEMDPKTGKAPFRRLSEMEWVERYITTLNLEPEYEDTSDSITGFWTYLDGKDTLIAYADFFRMLVIDGARHGYFPDRLMYYAYEWFDSDGELVLELDDKRISASVSDMSPHIVFTEPGFSRSIR